MSGHSKWSTIKHKKAKTDSLRAAEFQKFSREIIVASKLGGGDPAGNFRLRTAIEKAKAAGLPNDNIKRAIEKGCGSGNNENYEEITYEGYAAGGVAVVIEAMTDNRNRTAGDIRSYFTKFNGNLGETGCVGWMFDKKGCITFDANSVDFDKLFEAAINLDADDIQEEEDEYKVYTSVPNLQPIVEGLEKEGFKSVTAEFTRIPQNTVPVTDEKIATNVMRLLGRLEEHDDVQNVYANFDIDDDLMEKLDI
jgi:YebC/PmpR family DNA-binding regulatory protein